MSLGGKGKLVITPGGPRPPGMVHSVGPGQAVHVNKEGGLVVAEQTVLTPGGHRSKSLVHHIEPGYGLRHEQGRLRKFNVASNTVTDFPPVVVGATVPKRQAFVAARTGAAMEGATPGPVPALGSGWIVYTWWDSGSSTSINTFSTTWVVPQPPATYSGQTIFLFNGIQNTGAGFGILQPVLQYGPSAAGGGSHWSIASWYVTSDGQAFHTSLVNVNPGDTLIGVMSLTGHNASQYNYTSQFQGIANTQLPVQNINLLHWANETLEAYGVSQCSDYPASPSTPLKGINLLVGASHPSVSWTPVNSVTDCGQHAAVVSNSSVEGEVDLWYRTVTGTKSLSVARLSDGRLQLWGLGQNGALYSCWKTTTNPSAPWTTWGTFQALPGGNGQVPHGGNISDNRPQIFATNGSGTLYSCWKQSTDASSAWTAWSPFEAIPGGGAHAVAAGRLPDGQLQLFATNAAGTVYTCWKSTTDPSASWTAWSAFNNVGSGVTQLAIGPLSDGRLQLFAISSGGSISSCWKATTDSHSAWTSGSAFPPLPGGAAVIAMAPLSDRRLQLFAANPAGTLYSCWKTTTDSSAHWTAWSAFAPVPQSTVGLAAGNLEDGRIQLWSVAASGTAYSCWKQTTDSSSAWTPWSTFPPL